MEGNILESYARDIFRKKMTMSLSSFFNSEYLYR